MRTATAEIETLEAHQIGPSCSVTLNCFGTSTRNRFVAKQPGLSDSEQANSDTRNYQKPLVK